MGGFCCAARKPLLERTSYYMPSSEEQEPLTSNHNAAAGYVANLYTSRLDTFRAPPQPLPFDMLYGCPSPSHTTDPRRLSSLSPKEEEEVCPTCLEEYDDDNPKIKTQCNHHFHLACILDWRKRSDTCPICNQEMMYESEPLRYIKVD
ncbi:unnamed protein product [Cuscuta epithymum]|uniref:RING-type E3 ubiquitin transferase n=1 Tax=Cuscuta epithymum TaxID=186058 RepID=A0AAV0DEZ4_9ASTE|nr:unnamed protein product [Cuscuta epithymum]